MAELMTPTALAAITRWNTEFHALARPTGDPSVFSVPPEDQEDYETLEHALAMEVSGLLAEIARLREHAEASPRTGCPCTFPEVEPCSASCSCRTPIRSGGCARCARYGSAEQRLTRARWLVDQHYLSGAVPELFAKIEALTDRLRWRVVGVDGPPQESVWVLVDRGLREVETFSREGDYWQDGAFTVLHDRADRWLPIPGDAP